MRRTSTALLIAAALVLPAAASAGHEPDPPAKKADKRPATPAADKEETAPFVITNEWLEAHYGGAAPPSGVSGIARVGDGAGAATTAGEEAAAALPDPLAEIEDEQARERTRAMMIARLDGSIADAEASIAELERRLLAIKNPFLPRPTIPEDQAAEWETLSPTQRVERTEREIEDVRRRLESDRAQRARLAAAR